MKYYETFQSFFKIIFFIFTLNLQFILTYIHIFLLHNLMQSIKPYDLYSNYDFRILNLSFFFFLGYSISLYTTLGVGGET